MKGLVLYAFGVSLASAATLPRAKSDTLDFTNAPWKLAKRGRNSGTKKPTEYDENGRRIRRGTITTVRGGPPTRYHDHASFEAGVSAANEFTPQFSREELDCGEIPPLPGRPGVFDDSASETTFVRYAVDANGRGTPYHIGGLRADRMAYPDRASERFVPVSNEKVSSANRNKALNNLPTPTQYRDTIQRGEFPGAGHAPTSGRSHQSTAFLAPTAEGRGIESRMFAIANDHYRARVEGHPNWAIEYQDGGGDAPDGFYPYAAPVDENYRGYIPKFERQFTPPPPPRVVSASPPPASYRGSYYSGTPGWRRGDNRKRNVITGIQNDQGTQTASETTEEDMQLFEYWYTEAVANATDLVIPIIEALLNVTTNDIGYMMALDIYSLADSTVSTFGPFKNGMVSMDWLEPAADNQTAPEILAYEQFYRDSLVGLYNTSWTNAYSALNASGLLPQMISLAAALTYSNSSAINGSLIKESPNLPFFFDGYMDDPFFFGNYTITFPPLNDTAVYGNLSTSTNSSSASTTASNVTISFKH